MSYNIGRVFRLVREGRGYSLMNTSNNIVSLSCLSKFEKGETDISLNSFIRLINKLNIGLDELFTLNGQPTNDFKIFLNQLSILYHENNTLALQNLKDSELQIYKDTADDYHKYNSVIISALISDLDKMYVVSNDEMEFISGFLINIEIWTSYEIALFGNTITLLKSLTAITIIKELTTFIKSNKTTTTNLKSVIHLLQNATIIFLRRKEIDFAIFIFEKVNELIQPLDFFEKTRNLYISGLIELVRGNNEKGIELINDSILIMNKLEPSFASEHQADFKLFCEHMDIQLSS